MWRKVGAATCVPLTLAAIQSSAWAQPDEVLGSTFTFHHENVLGTSLELRVRAHDSAAAGRAETAVLAEFDRQDRILSSWRKDSELSRWAATRFTAVPVSPELYRTLAQFDMWRKKTGGALDPSVEAAARLWRTASAESRTPTNAEIEQTAEAMQQPHWSLDAAHRTATRLTDVPLTFATFVKSSISSAAADAALNAGATGVMLNVGGDVVVRGAISQIVSIANPRASAENDPALEHIVVRDRAVATSGSYRRGVEAKAQLSLRAPKLSHILDPRTASPAGHILSSTVIATDAETAGALATAFSVLPAEESRELAARTPGVDYLIVTRDGETIRSAGLEKYGVPALRIAAYAPSAPAADVKAVAGMWNAQFELAIGLEITRISDARAKRPYVAVWIEDADHFPIRTLALWTEKPRWIPELKQWYRDEQIRSMTEGNDLSRTVSSATRPAGHYTLSWDGKDNEGKPVKAGTYTVCVEAAREHGSYQVQRHALELKGQPQQFAFPAGEELGAVTIEYRKR
jgi:thiamine biosynthesis lipoprotein ApbE